MDNKQPKATVAYVLRRFPVLSETFILNEILELERQGVNVHIFSLLRSNDPCFHQNLHHLKAHITYVPEKLEIKRLFKNFFRAARYYPKEFQATLRYVIWQRKPSLFFRFLQSCFIANKLRDTDCSHLHSHFANKPTSAAFLTSMLTNIPFSFTTHAVDIFKRSLCKKALERKIHHAKFVVAVSDYNRKFLEKRTAKSSEKLIKIPNGIDLDFFQPQKDKSSEPFTFLCVARFVEKKGHQVLVKACELLREQGEKFRCILIGKGKLQKQIEEAIQEKQLEKFVTILGPKSQNDVLEHYQSSNAFVLPCTTGSDGNRDGLPVSIVEALACGLPVITTPMTGNPEVVQDGGNGVLVPFNDPEQTANAMKKLMNEKTWYDQLSQNARNSVEKTFDKRETVVSLAKLFEESVR